MFECVIASAAKQSRSAHGVRWIASSQGLLAMTGKQLYFHGLHFESDSEEHRPSDASRRIEATARPSWFSERCQRVARMRAPDERKRSRRDDRLRIVRRRHTTWSVD